MLCLRVARGSRPGAVLRRLLLAAVSAGSGFLLLCALGYALAHPERAGAAGIRLLWCLVPAAAAVHLSVAVSRMPSRGRASGLAATGYGASRLPLLAAAGTGLSCAFGSALALLAFLNVRGGLLGAEPALPLAGTLTLLALVPLLGATATAMALRPRAIRPPRERAGGDRNERDESRSEVSDNGAAEEEAAEGAAEGAAADGARASGVPEAPPEAPLAAPAGLPWGAVLVATGLVVELYADRWQPSHPGDRIALPGGLGDLSSTMLAGWSLTAVGFVLAGPGLVHLCGQLLSAARPGALRLIAGRGLQAEAARIGRPLGVLCTAGSAALAAARLSTVSVEPRPGPLTALGAALVLVCAVATVLAAAAESRSARAPVTGTLTRLGASAVMLRRVVAVRVAALLALLVPLTWLVAELAARPMYF